MNLPKWDDGREALEDFATLTRLTEKDVYTDADKEQILETMRKHAGLVTKETSKFICLRRIRGQLIRKPKDGAPFVVATGRGDWIGWFELVTKPVSETAIKMTAKVIAEMKADVQAVVEVEGRIALQQFNDEILPVVGGTPYAHALSIDCNDERGIDVGVLSGSQYPIELISTHIDDSVDGKRIFRRDCCEYFVTTPSGDKVLVLVTHLKSKGYGTQAGNDAIRLAEAVRIREIYDERRAEGFEFVAVVGDFNDIPGSAPLEPLIGAGSDLKDIFDHEKFRPDGRPGTHGNGTKSAKLDYILLSPALWKKVRCAGIERRGVWGGKNGTMWPIFPEMKSANDAASDHAGLWVEVGL